eukprot:CFRG5103T1
MSQIFISQVSVGDETVDEITISSRSIYDNYTEADLAWNLYNTSLSSFQDNGVNASRVVVWVPYPKSPASVLASGLTVTALAQVCMNQKFSSSRNRTAHAGNNDTAIPQQPIALVFNLLLVGWSNMQRMLGNNQYMQPDIALIGTTQVSNFYRLGTLLSLDQFLQEEMQSTAVNLLEDIPAPYFTDYNHDGNWYVVPFVSDTRQLLYNASTFNALGLTHPPPNGNGSWGAQYVDWTWDSFVKISRNISDSGLGYGFTFVPDYDEEIKLMTMMCRAYGGLTFLSNDTNLGQEYSSGINKQAYYKGLNNTIWRMIRDGSMDPHIFPTNDTMLWQWMKSWPNVSNTVPPFESYYASPDISFTGMRFSTDSPLPKSDEVKTAYPPGTIAYSGGAGFAITSSSNFPWNAWYFLRNATNTNSLVLPMVNLALEKAPPYKSMWTLSPWNTSRWSTYIHTFSTGSSTPFPLSTPPSFGGVESVKPLRSTLLSIILMNSTLEEAQSVGSNVLNYQLLPECSWDIDFEPNTSLPCDCATGKATIEYEKGDRRVCRYAGDYWPLANTTYFYSCGFIGTQTATAYAMYALVCCGLILTLSTMLALHCQRKHAFIRGASYLFSQIILLGVLISYIAAASFVGPPAVSKTTAQLWLISIGYTMILASLIVKLYRVWKVFVSNDIQRNLKLTDKHLLVPFTVLILLGVILLLIGTFYGDSFVTLVPLETTLTLHSDTKDFFVNDIYIEHIRLNIGNAILMIAYGAFLLIIAIILGFRVRNVPSKFNETTFILAVIYQILFVTCVMAPVMVFMVIEENDNAFTFSAFGVLFVSGTFISIVLFFPKLLASSRRFRHFLPKGLYMDGTHESKDVNTYTTPCRHNTSGMPSQEYQTSAMPSLAEFSPNSHSRMDSGKAGWHRSYLNGNMHIDERSEYSSDDGDEKVQGENDCLLCGNDTTCPCDVKCTCLPEEQCRVHQLCFRIRKDRVQLTKAKLKCRTFKLSHTSNPSVNMSAAHDTHFDADLSRAPRLLHRPVEHRKIRNEIVVPSPPEFSFNRRSTSPLIMYTSGDLSVDDDLAPHHRTCSESDLYNIQNIQIMHDDATIALQIPIKSGKI